MVNEIVSEKGIEKLTQVLAPYMHTANNLTAINDSTAPQILSILAEGFGKVISYRAEAHRRANRIKTQRKYVEAIAVTERFDKWCESKNQKSTDKSKDLFISQDNDVIKVRDEEADLEAIAIFLDGIYQLLMMSISSAKTIAFSTPNSRTTDGIKNYSSF